MKKILKPWGYYKEYLNLFNKLKIKILCVYPNEETSLQYHKERSEIWFFLNNNNILIDNKELLKMPILKFLKFKPLAEHRLSNFSDKNVYVLEIQYGKKCIENDIVRLQDNYNRL